MTSSNPSVMAAVKRKLNVTWEDETTDARIQDVVDVVSPRLASLLGFDPMYAFSPADGMAWGLFLNGCLYEFSDAWDDFAANYASEILSVRIHNVGNAHA